MPCSGPRGPLAARSRSSASASRRAFGLTITIAFKCGPVRSYAAMRATYSDTSCLGGDLARLHGVLQLWNRLLEDLEPGGLGEERGAGEEHESNHHHHAHGGKLYRIRVKDRLTAAAVRQEP